jgi:glyoxylase-like metal-dependent hydrolase (beta-lactamase superfamily II)
MEIAPGIHRIKCKFGTKRMVYIHLLVGDEAAMLVDTGCAHNPNQEILPYMESIGFDPRRLTYILISHSDSDHQGGNQRMKEVAPQAVLMCHNLDRPWVEDTDALIQGRYSQFEKDHGIGPSEADKAGTRASCLSWPLDMTLEGGETFRLGKDWVVEAIHTPGHTWGHMAVYDPRSKTLIAGEAGLLTAILDDDWQTAMPPTYCYVDTYLNTQERLMAMNIETLSSAHWPVQTGKDVGEFFRESRNYCLLIERTLLELAHECPSFTLKEAISQRASRLGSWPAGTSQELSYPMSGHLHRLVQRGLLKTGRSADGYVTWSLDQ